MRLVLRFAPIVAAVISAFSAWSAHGFHMPVWQQLWRKLCDTSLASADGFDRGAPLPEPEPASWFTDTCLQSGVCSALSRVRERHPTMMDGRDISDRGASASCRHDFQQHRSTTGGLFCLLCPHGICFAFS